MSRRTTLLSTAFALVVLAGCGSSSDSYDDTDPGPARTGGSAAMHTEISTDCPTAAEVSTVVGRTVEQVGEPSVVNDVTTCTWGGQDDPKFSVGLSIRDQGTTEEQFAVLKSGTVGMGHTVADYPGFGEEAFSALLPDALSGGYDSADVVARFGGRVAQATVTDQDPSFDTCKAVIELLF